MINLTKLEVNGEILEWDENQSEDLKSRSFGCVEVFGEFIEVYGTQDEYIGFIPHEDPSEFVLVGHCAPLDGLVNYDDTDDDFEIEAIKQIKDLIK